MKLEDMQSSNLEDRRGEANVGNSTTLETMLGGGGGKLGLGTIVVLAIIAYLLGIDPRVLIGGAELVSGGVSSSSSSAPASPPLSASSQNNVKITDKLGRFVSTILAETEDVWSQVLPEQMNIRYTPPKLVLFNGATRSACGQANEAMGPFYCPLDQKVYLDTNFFNEMKSRLGGGGDFAYAYVIAHEIGHHVQNLMGILPKVQRAQQNASSKAEANALSVKTELMADCLAGVFAANADKKWQIIEPGDVQEAMNTTQAIGDDALQRAARGYVVPDSFTHGSAAQRQQWFTNGLTSGQINACNTFKGGN